MQVLQRGGKQGGDDRGCGSPLARDDEKVLRARGMVAARIWKLPEAPILRTLR